MKHAERLDLLRSRKNRPRLATGQGAELRPRGRRCSCQFRPLFELAHPRNMTDGVRLRECRFRIPPKSDPEWLQQELVD